MPGRRFHDRGVRTKLKPFLLATLLTLGIQLLAGAAAGASRPAPDPALLQSTYSGEETLTYEITWLGIVAGRLVIHLAPDERDGTRFAIRVSVRSVGPLNAVYPVDDRFETMVEGAERLPTRYHVDQHEGRRQKKRLTLYDQRTGTITYRRNDEPAKVYTVTGPTYNEFASFMIMRTLPLAVGSTAMVPTFADGKRHEVELTVEKEARLRSVFGPMDAIRIRPHLTFKGLYTKTGDPEIWLSNDADRLPLLIKAKIVIGSLTARLVAHSRRTDVRPAAITTAAPEKNDAVAPR